MPTENVERAWEAILKYFPEGKNVRYQQALKAAALECFLHRIEGEDVEVIRRALARYYDQ